MTRQFQLPLSSSIARSISSSTISTFRIILLRCFHSNVTSTVVRCPSTLFSILAPTCFAVLKQNTTNFSGLVINVDRDGGIFHPYQEMTVQSFNHYMDVATAVAQSSFYRVPNQFVHDEERGWLSRQVHKQGEGQALVGCLSRLVAPTRSVTISLATSAMSNRRHPQA